MCSHGREGRGGQGGALCCSGRGGADAIGGNADVSSTACVHTGTSYRPPRGGDFCYSEIEFEQMKSDIDFIRELGFPGLVVGLLDIDGHIDLPRMQQVMKHCQGMAVTFHRAFDLCHSPLLAMTN